MQPGPFCQVMVAPVPALLTTTLVTLALMEPCALTTGGVAASWISRMTTKASTMLAATAAASLVRKEGNIGNPLLA